MRRCLGGKKDGSSSPPLSEVMPQYITLLAHARARCLCKLSRKYFAEGVRGRGGPVSEKRYPVFLPGVVGWGWGRTKTGFGSSAREDDHKGQAKKRDDDDSPVGKDCKKWGGGRLKQ